MRPLISSAALQMLRPRHDCHCSSLLAALVRGRADLLQSGELMISHPVSGNASTRIDRDEVDHFPSRNLCQCRGVCFWA